MLASYWIMTCSFLFFCWLVVSRIVLCDFLGVPVPSKSCSWRLISYAGPPHLLTSWPFTYSYCLTCYFRAVCQSCTRIEASGHYHLSSPWYCRKMRSASTTLSSLFWGCLMWLMCLRVTKVSNILAGPIFINSKLVNKLLKNCFMILTRNSS